MKRKRKALGDESLSWIDQTGESAELEVLKQYVSEEAEPQKGETPEPSSLFPNDTPTIVKKKKRGKQMEEKSEEMPSVSGNEAIVEEIKEEVKEIEEVLSEKEEATKIDTEEKKIQKEISYEKIKVKTAEALGTVKEKGTQVVDAISKTFGSEKLNIKKIVDSVVSTCSQPIRALSSIDRNINNSVKKIMHIDDKSLIDKNVVKPIKNLETSINHEIKKFLDAIL